MRYITTHFGSFQPMNCLLYDHVIDHVRVASLVIIREDSSIIIIVELIQRNITATRAVSVRFTTYYYRDRPVHSRANFNPLGGIQESCRVRGAATQANTILSLPFASRTHFKYCWVDRGNRSQTPFPRVQRSGQGRDRSRDLRPTRPTLYRCATTPP